MRDTYFMQRCLQLASAGLGTTYPNPLVGSVIVHNEVIIGEGWHQKAGGPHAEVEAVRSVKDLSLLPAATLYVNLEPCSHFGKTPPCADMIISSGIRKVVVGTKDPNPVVSGNGIKKLREAGIDVVVDVLANECRELNRRFFTFYEQARPYIILKWAQTANGFIAPLTKEKLAPVWISDAFSRQLVHKWRTEEQSILVGTQTAIDDNPSLTARDWQGSNPIRLVIDKSNRIPIDSRVLDHEASTIVFTEADNDSAEDNVIYLKTDFNRIPEDILRILFERRIISVVVEGGAKTLQAFIDAGLWDEARVFIAKFDWTDGIKAPEISAKTVERIQLGADELITYRR